MSDKVGRTSIELARELGVKPSEIVECVGEIRNIQFKKRTTNIKIEPEEVEEIIKKFQKTSQPEQKKKKGRREKTKPSELKKTEEQKVTDKQEISSPTISDEEIKEEEITIPGKFRREISFEKIEKIKPKPVFTKITPKKFEPQKWLDIKEQKKIKDKVKKEEPSTTPSTAPRKKSIRIEEGTTVKEFAELIGQKVPDV